MPDTATDAARESANGWLTWIVIPSAFLGSLVTLILYRRRRSAEA
jgi:LPXTG-motif cell wall-anchored protein